MPDLRRGWFLDHSPGNNGVIIPPIPTPCTFGEAPVTLGTLPSANDLGTGQLSAAWGSNTDGSLIVGFGPDSAGTIRALTYAGGVVTDIGGLASTTHSDAFGCNGVGNIIVGRCIVGGVNVATVWTAGSPTSLGFLPGGTTSYAAYCDLTGNIIVGHSTVAGVRNAVFWTAGVITDLGNTGGNTIANGCNVDGSVVVGQGITAGVTHAVKWTNGGAPVTLGEYGSDTDSRALKCSGDGTIIVGDSYTPAGDQHAVYWDSGGVHLLEGFYGGHNAIATGISTNGDVISGYCNDASNNYFWPLVWRDFDLSVMRIGEVTGAELVTNGTFTGSAAGWTLGADVTYGSNKVTVVCSGGAGSLTRTSQTGIATTADSIYELIFTISGASPAGAGAIFFFTHNTVFTGTYIDGTYSAVFKANYTGSDVLFFQNSLGNAGDTWSLDNVSLKELTATVQPSSGLEVQNISPDGEVIMGQGAYNPGAVKNAAIKWLCT